MKRKKINKIFILDPSLINKNGHHFALTNLISEGAQDYADNVVWLVNKEFKEKINFNEKTVIKPIFDYSAYNLSAKKRKITRRIKKILKHDTIVLFYLFFYLFFNLFLNKVILKLNVKSINIFFDKFVETLNSLRIRRMEKFPEIYNVHEEERTAVDFFCEKMQPLIDSGYIEESDHIVIHTADGIIYRGILKLILNNDKIYLPNFHISTPYNFNYMPFGREGMQLDRVIKYFDKLNMLDQKIFLYSETEPLTSFFKKLLNADVVTLNLPVPISNFVSIDKLKENTNNNFTVLYAGAAREEKGFHLLPDIIKNVMRLNTENIDIKFLIQSHAQNTGYTKTIKKTIKRLKQFDKKQVKLIGMQKKMEDYYKVINQSDSVLLCYDQQKYDTRGSGIAIDALCSGKIIVGTTGTYPAYVAQEKKLSGANAEEFAKAIIYAAANKELLFKKIDKMKNKYITENTPGSFVQKILNNYEAKNRKKPASKSQYTENKKTKSSLKNSYDKRYRFVRL